MHGADFNGVPKKQLREECECFLLVIVLSIGSDMCGEWCMYVYVNKINKDIHLSVYLEIYVYTYTYIYICLYK